MTAPRVNEARWFMAGLTTGEHLAETLGGTFSDGYDAGHADGYRVGYEAHAAEQVAQHGALWAEVGPRVEAWPLTAHNRSASAGRWNRTFGGTRWDSEAERARCIASWQEVTAP